MANQFTVTLHRRCSVGHCKNNAGTNQLHRCGPCEQKAHVAAFRRNRRNWELDRMMGGGKGPEHAPLWD